MNLEKVMQVLPFLLEGAVVTFEISILAIIIGTLLGFLLAALRLSNNKLVQLFAIVYIWVFRGVPILMVLVFIYYTPPFGITLSAFAAGLLGLSLNAAAYKAEIIRTGMLAIPKGQIEAAEAIGMTPWQILIRIRIPQIIRFIIPTYISNSVALLKESAQVSVITVPDLMLNAQSQFSSTYMPLETLGVAAVLYLIMTSVLMSLQIYSERKLKLNHGYK
ncbi:cystine ABC transporter permease [Paenibacillus vulneris]|uniref:Amino acid ABC transporter permease n=1 Tax=Paenibacillus vulneris TaxID=1133364 RepID=A0ABW3UPI2_9BACL|nr:amino acid ABC transporter permease [Paenibacillus sp. 32352]